MTSQNNERKRAVFQQLQPVCSKLLEQRHDAPSMVQQLNALSTALADVDKLGLRGCFDYVLFPILFLIDSILALRSKAGNDTKSDETS